jgi:co-chaperonin GroES (HSP10)
MNIKPLRDKIIVKPEVRFKSELLDLSKVEGAHTTGHVIAIGDEAKRMGLKIGDKVYFGTVADTAKDEYLKFDGIKIGEDNCLKMSWQDVCFVEEQDA